MWARCIIGLGACLGIEGPGSSGQEEAPKPELTARRLDAFKMAAGAYRIALETAPPRPLTLQPEPMLRWTNPLRKTSDGAVFLWVSEGQPAAIACFYQYGATDSGQEHEFQSLATTRLTATRDGRDVWFPKTAGVTPVPIPGAHGPAATPADRLRQMSALAREFKAFLDAPDNHVLRLLSKPIYRYETPQADAADGALFAFVQATDPEALLLIEIRNHNGAPAWHYALVRMSRVQLRAEHKDQVVWRVEREDDETNPGKPYITLHNVRSEVAGLNP